MEKIDLAEKFSLFDETWRPKTVARPVDRLIAPEVVTAPGARSWTLSGTSGSRAHVQQAARPPPETPIGCSGRLYVTNISAREAQTHAPRSPQAANAFRH